MKKKYVPIVPIYFFPFLLEIRLYIVRDKNNNILFTYTFSREDHLGIWQTSSRNFGILYQETGKLRENGFTSMGERN